MNQDQQVRLRHFQASDGVPLLELFRDTVHRVNCGDYTPSQLAAWAPEDYPSDAWCARFEGRISFVAEIDAEPVGFVDMTPSGHLDRLFVSTDYQRKGIGRGLVEATIESAIALNLKTITTDASITAKPFFLSQGFVVVKEQTVACRTEYFTNFKMRLTFDQGKVKA